VGMVLDFTIHSYKLLLKTLDNQGFRFQTVADFIQDVKDNTIILRHDVDSLPKNALNTALFENQSGIYATYYFRVVPESWDAEIIQEISSLGHEMGYHYENLSHANGDSELAIRDFEKNLKEFRKIHPVKTICMHGSPFSKYDNRDLWKYYDYRDFGIIAEPYFDIDFSKVLYLTDTGRRWDGDFVSVRDKIGGQGPEARSRRSEVGGQRSDVGGQRSEGRGKNAKIKTDMSEGNRDEQRHEFSSGTSGRVRDEAHNERVGGLEDKKVRKDKNLIQSQNSAERIKKRFDHLRFRSTFDIIEAAEKGLLPDKIMINVHPQRWNDKFIPWAKEFVWQNMKNVVKKYYFVKRVKNIKHVTS